MWTLVFSSDFEEWLTSLSEDEQNSVAAILEILRMQGPHLPRPHADVIHGSRISNLKELRVQHRGSPYRVFYAFDPLRQAMVLCGGNKTGDKRFYVRMIPIAERIWFDYIKGLQ